MHVVGEAKILLHQPPTFEAWGAIISGWLRGAFYTSALSHAVRPPGPSDCRKSGQQPSNRWKRAALASWQGAGGNICMYTLVANVYINRPPQEVFSYVYDPANSPEWQSGVLAAEWIPSGKPEAGATLRVVRSLLGRRVENLSQVTVWDPPRQEIRKSFKWPALEISSIFEPLDKGTMLTLKAQAELSGALRLVERLAGEMIKRQIVSEYTRLKKVLEAGQSYERVKRSERSRLRPGEIPTQPQFRNTA